MTRNLIVVFSGGALAFALAGAAGPTVAWGSARPAVGAQAKLFLPDGTPIIRDSTAQLSDPDSGGQ